MPDLKRYAKVESSQPSLVKEPQSCDRTTEALPRPNAPRSVTSSLAASNPFADASTIAEEACGLATPDAFEPTYAQIVNHWSDRVSWNRLVWIDNHTAFIRDDEELRFNERWEQSRHPQFQTDVDLEEIPVHQLTRLLNKR